VIYSLKGISKFLFVLFYHKKNFRFILYSSTNDGYAADALEDPSLGDIVTEHLRVHESMRDKPHFG